MNLKAKVAKNIPYNISLGGEILRKFDGRFCENLDFLFKILRFSCDSQNLTRSAESSAFFRHCEKSHFGRLRGNLYYLRFCVFYLICIIALQIVIPSE
ncbi:hypothetical protein [Helicobacter sp. 23-1045]